MSDRKENPFLLRPPTSPLTSPLIGLLAAALLACLGYFAVEVWLLSGDIGFPLDDSLIHLQFARNLVAGEGLAYNPGQLVTGSTAPLWTALPALPPHPPGNAVGRAHVRGLGSPP